MIVLFSRWQAASLTASPPVAAGAQSLSPRSDAEEQQGVQYEGYAQVMADLDKQVRTPWYADVRA